MPITVALIDTPPERWLERELHRAVRDHSLSEHRHRFDPVLHAGWPSGPHRHVVLDSAVHNIEDAALREDVLSALVTTQIAHYADADERGLLLWLNRPGDLELCDLEARWSAALHAVADTDWSAQTESSTRVPVRFVVCNKRAWVDPVTRVGRSWQRIRQRRTPARARTG